MRKFIYYYEKYFLMKRQTTGDIVEETVKENSTY
jgi:hypothetical protein